LIIAGTLFKRYGLNFPETTNVREFKLISVI
jgi:hypothetical protein